MEYVTQMKKNSNEFEYVVVVQMQGRQVNNEDSQIEQLNSLHLIPSSTGDISIGSFVQFEKYPLYFQLPKQFLGDKVTSYAGLLQYSVIAEHCNLTLSVEILQRYPLVQIHAYDGLVLDYFGVSFGCV